jgi:hypothetical protein
MKIEILALIFSLLGLSFYSSWIFRKIIPKWYIAELVTASFIGGVLLWAWLQFLLSIVLPTEASIWLCLVLSVILSILVYRKGKPMQRERLTPTTAAIWWAFAVVTAIIFTILLSKVTFYPVKNYWLSTGGAWGDLPMHSALVTYLADQVKMNFTYPLLLKTKLVYPFLIDFVSALFYRSGLSLRLSLLVPSLLLWWAAAHLLFGLGYRLFRSAAVGVLASLVFFLNGSFYGMFAAWHLWKASGLSFSQYFGSLSTDFTQVHDQGLELMNLTASHILPQKGIVFGLAGVLLAWLLLIRSREEKTAPWWWIPVGVVVGMLPLIHLHSFLFMVAVLVTGTLINQKADRWNWGKTLLLALLLALPQLIYQLVGQHMAGYQSGPFITEQLGWLTPKGENVVQFWWENAGPFILLLIGIVAVRHYWKDVFYRSLLIPALFFAVVLNLISLQPNVFDNYKLFFYVWLVGSLLGAGLMVQLWENGWWFRVLVPLWVAFLTIPGALSLLSVDETQHALFSNEDIQWAATVRSLTPNDAVILTSGEHNNPIPALAGRRIVRGYPGWLWSYGWVTTPLDQDMSTMWAGGEKSRALIQKYGITYIAIRLPNQGAYFSYQENPMPNPALFDLMYPRMASSDSWVLYKVQ